MLATSDDKQVFLESFDFCSVRETGANLLIVVKESIKQAKERFDTEVYAVVSDHASSMENMGAAVKS